MTTPFDARLISALSNATRLVVLTGAGVSAESGIPTFRERQTGLWERFDAAELATPEAFDQDPALVWGWYEWRRLITMKAQPNRAHQAIADFADLFPVLTLVSQNVDDLHERAGSPEVLHLHGELSKPRCEHCKTLYALPTTPPDIPDGGIKIEPPQCPECLWRVRPGVVWFGETLAEPAWTLAREATDQCDAFLCVGTSAIVQPAGSLWLRAKERRAVTIQINKNSTDLDDQVDFAIREPVGLALPKILENLLASR